jgi:hypothetical protein
MVQKTAREKRILTVNANAVPVEELTKKGAEKVRVQYLVDERHGSNRFALRQYTVEKGGTLPLTNMSMSIKSMYSRGEACSEKQNITQF